YVDLPLPWPLVVTVTIPSSRCTSASWIPKSAPPASRYPLATGAWLDHAGTRSLCPHTSQERPYLLHRKRSEGHIILLWRDDVFHRRCPYLALRVEPGEELPQGAVAAERRLRGAALVQHAQERFDVLPGDVLHLERHAHVGQIRAELIGCGQGALARLQAQPSRLQAPLPACHHRGIGWRPHAREIGDCALAWPIAGHATSTDRYGSSHD